MKYPVYRKYKPSGVEWLGDVPEHWGVLQTNFAFAIQLGKMLQPEPANDSEEEVPYLKAQHAQWEKVRVSDLPTMWASATDQAKYSVADGDLLVCEGGDVVFARRGEMGRCAVVGEEESGWLCGTGSMIIRLSDCDARYFARVFRSAGFSALLTLNAVGTTMLNLNPSIVGRMRVPLPPLPEQCAISDHLDRETAKIDRMVAKVEEAIERLQEYRTALITAAVTGKIDVRTKH